METVVVRGSPQESVEALSGTASVGREALEASPKSDLDKVLRGLPGVTLLRTTRGGQSVFSLRGASGGQGQWMLDGIPLYGTLTGVYDFDGFAPDLLEKVEIERGAAGIRHGGQALGGTLRLSARDERETGARFHLQGGSFGTLAETAVGSLAGPRARATLAARREDLFDGVSQADFRNGNREREDYRGNLSLLRYRAEPSDRLALDGTFYHGFTRAGLDGPGITPDGRPGWMDDTSAYGSTETWVGQQTARVRISPGWESGLQFGYQNTRPHVCIRGIRAGSDSRLLLLRWRNTHGFSGFGAPDDELRWAWGIDAREETIQAAGPAGRFDDQRGQIAGFADLEAGYGSWSGMAGIRIDRYEAQTTHATYYLGAGFQATPRLALRASGGHGYRIPSYHERYFPLTGNPALRPESSDSGQIGFDWNPAPNLRVSATGFYHRYTNLIRVSLVPSMGLLSVANVPRAQVGGVELEATHEFAPFVLGLAYTLQASEDLDSGRSLARLPRNQGKIFGSWRFGGLPVLFGAELMYRDGYYADNGGVLRMGDSWCVNVQAVHALTPWAQIYVRGENLSNDLTPDEFGFGKPGAAMYAGLKLTFR